MPRRTFTREFQESAARLVTEQGDSQAQAAESLGVDRASIAPPQPAPGGANAEGFPRDSRPQGFRVVSYDD